MPSINSTHITTEKLMPMVEATTKAAAVVAIPITTTTSTIIKNLSVASSNGQKRTIIIYPTVSPESIVIPIVSCIFGFPLLALLVICCLRHRAKMARERDRRRNYDLQDHAVSLVRFSPIHRLTNRTTRAVSLRSERSLSRGFPSLDLDTVLEERSDQEQTQTDLMTPESPSDPHYRACESSSS
ncbi:uncharacterized protein LOC116346655 [Contarinia nasturtii]|uniref:uncharacterized protein LOC116346655 n=1 Tax=Contarinia nasturtii TaxID=265458 RepID=UPI0012D3F54F|nr:uncharacterized protein LOC116346655 [Contarinia nasturtii]XP_031632684.1 uncharacterized protein LOC116346655 [Contarinia nasturtii]XP_031632685.1 uncharacterized protein LOC116346655 [Contarinia nasturtii]XP_031632686.1 uncharacterized protein LOC116346655 [Contarinia nasturtii]